MRCILGYISASIPQNLQTRAVCRYIQINLWKKNWSQGGTLVHSSRQDACRLLLRVYMSGYLWMKVGVNCKLPNKDMKEIKSNMQSLWHRSVALNISHLNTKTYLGQHIATAKNTTMAHWNRFQSWRYGWHGICHNACLRCLFRYNQCVTSRKQISNFYSICCFQCFYWYLHEAKQSCWSRWGSRSE